MTNFKGLDMSIFEKYNAVINMSPSNYEFLSSNENYIHLPVMVKHRKETYFNSIFRMGKAIKINWQKYFLPHLNLFLCI